MDSYPGALGQLITNLVSNALQHGFENRTSGQMRLFAETAPNERIILHFTDDGVGMSESVLDEINRRLTNPEVAKNSEEKGRLGGIALVNVHNRIKLLFGEPFGLRVSSILGLGTRVEITLPIRQSTDR